MRASTLVGTSATRPLYPHKEGKCGTLVPVPTPSKPPGGRGSHKVGVNPIASTPQSVVLENHLFTGRLSWPEKEC